MTEPSPKGIRMRRKMLHIGVREASRRLHVSCAAISSWEGKNGGPAGNRSVPPSKRAALARLLSCTVADLGVVPKPTKKNLVDMLTE